MHSIRKRAGWLAALATTSLILSALIAAPVSADPPGNNGTVKIDGLPFDDHPNNEPHPGCVFQVDFYGYDEGADLMASVTFEHWNPTGDGHGDVLLHEENIFIGEDDNGGGGSEAGLDASRTYDLRTQLAGMDPHPQQGFHIKLTVHADGSQGADVKHKVFWVECPGPGGGEQGTFLLAKVDQAGAGRAGAVFTLTGVTNPSFSATATTSGTGSASFSGLVAGTYSLAETTAPTGCTGFPGSITIVVDSDGDVSTTGTLPSGVTFTNGTLRVMNTCGASITNFGNLPLLKVDASGAGRAGAVFTLTGVMGTSFTGTATTGTTGSASFGTLAAGSYSLAETTPPTGCTGITTSIAITVAASGTVSVGTLPTGVTFSSGTLRIVNNCGQGGQLPSGGGPSQAPVRGGALAGGGAPVGALPNTALPIEATGAVPTALAALLMIGGLGVAVAGTFAEARRRR